MAGITTGNIAAVLEEINDLPSASRTDINQVIKIAHKYEVVGNIGSNRVNGVTSFTYMEVGLIPAKSKNKMGLVSLIRKLPVESRDSYAEIKAAIDAEIAKIAARINRKVK
jgi:hypothetical protein